MALDLSFVSEGFMSFAAVLVLILTGLFVLSWLFKHLSSILTGIKGKTKGENDIEAVQRSERQAEALSDLELRLTEQEIENTKQKYLLIRKNLEIAQQIQAPEQKNVQGELSAIIKQIISLIDQEIRLIKNSIKDAKDEIAVLLEEIKHSSDAVNDSKKEVAETKDQGEIILAQKSIAGEEDIMKILNQRLGMAKEQLGKLEEIDSVLSGGWFKKTQLKEAKKEEELLPKGELKNKARDISNIAKYLSDSEIKIIKSEQRLGQIIKDLKVLEENTEQLIIKAAVEEAKLGQIEERRAA